MGASDVNGSVLPCFSSWMSSGDGVSTLSWSLSVSEPGSRSDSGPSGGVGIAKVGLWSSSSKWIETAGDIRVTLWISIFDGEGDEESHLDGETIGEGGNAARSPNNQCSS